MPSDNGIEFRLGISVDEGGLEAAIRALRRQTMTVMYELKKRRRDGPKPSEKRRNKSWFGKQRQNRLERNIRRECAETRFWTMIRDACEVRAFEKTADDVE